MFRPMTTQRTILEVTLPASVRKIIILLANCFEANLVEHGGDSFGRRWCVSKSVIAEWNSTEGTISDLLIALALCMYVLPGIGLILFNPHAQNDLKNGRSGLLESVTQVKRDIFDNLIYGYGANFY